MKFQAFPSLFALAALVVAPLQAQLDPRLQACKTDVLDVYKGGKTGARPEIITLIDRSGSMSAAAWDARYYTNTATNWHSPAILQEYWADWRWEIRRYFGDPSGDNSRTNIRIINDQTSYKNILFTANMGYMKGGILIKPNGDPVTTDDGPGNSILNWVKMASHIRFAITSKNESDTPTYTYKSISYNIPSSNCRVYSRNLSNTGEYKPGSSYGNIQTADQTRVIDIPIPWAVFDRVPQHEQRNLSPSPNQLNTARNEKHPQHTYLFDPVPNSSGAQTSTAQYYEIDTSWWAPGNQNNPALSGLNGELLDSNGYFRDIDYNPDYIAWCLVGQDIRNINENGDFNQKMVDKYTGTNDGGYVVADARDGAAGFLKFTRDGKDWEGNGLPCMTRMQSVKYALIKTWISEQNNVWWGIRFLKTDTSGFQENGLSTAPNSFNSNNSNGSPGDRQILTLLKPTTSQNPDTSMGYIQVIRPNGVTPLTFGLLNTYAQMASTDTGNSGSVFNYNKTEGTLTPKLPMPTCRRSFVVVLSDGNPNDDDDSPSGSDGDALGSGDPFASGEFNTIAFNTIAPKGVNFNIWTLAGVAAHVNPDELDAKQKVGWPTDDDSAGVLPPFRVTSRPAAVTRRISTMTIGVSMAGTRTDADGAKMGLYKTALYGWEDRGSFTPGNLPLPYKKDDPTRNDKVKNPFFFEAQSPEDIADALAETFSLARSVTNTMSAPVAPLLGLEVGNQMYVGSFTSVADQPIWHGDLMMVGMKNTADGRSKYLTHKNGTPLTDPISVDTAVWSSSLMLTGKGWKNRTLYTLKPDTTNTKIFTSTLLDWKETTSTTDLPNSVLDVGSTAQRLALIRFMLGASPEAQADPEPVSTISQSRDNIMGDIIHSTPAIIEFPLTMIPSGSTLASWHASNSTLQGLRFRVILVGTNQGLLHAFGEVSGTDASGTIKATVDELWSFIPPDFLGGLRLWSTTLSPNTPKRYLVDGSPIVYLNEQGNPNGRADGTDVLRVVFGLRKGGRSYYCFKFDSNNPDKPEIAWMLRPDDASDATIKTMGFSSGTPVASRILDGTTLKDVFLIGGGLSTSDVDTAFSAADPVGYGAGTLLGRSIIAVEVSQGTIVKKWDFINDDALKALKPGLGSIASGVVPVEVINQSNKTQRVYFTDYSGGLNALGAVAPSGLRSESANIQSWSVRTLFKSKFPGTVVSTSPTVFPIPMGYPVIRTSDPKPIVPAWGVVVGTGDRNDPMDNDSINPGGGGADKSNRIVLVLDRQDSADITASKGKVDKVGFTEDDLENLTAISDPTASVLNPSSDQYYLKTKFGYFLNFANGTLKKGTQSEYYYEKQVISATVLNGALFFTKFAPSTTTDVCSPAGGTSYTYRMNKVLAPVYGSGSTQATSDSQSGWVVKFNDIPSEHASLGLTGIAQLGEVQDQGGGTGRIRPELLPAPPTSILPRPRAWRIVR